MISKINVLSGNTLKILAAIFMVFDHIGVLLYPSVLWLRIIGRLSFPIFAFMIAEGAKYTRNKIKYFLSLSVLALICQLVYYFFDGGSLYMCILVTFSISILLIYLLQFVKRTVFDENKKTYIKVLAMLLFFAACIAVYFVNTSAFSERTGIVIDYGFAGIMVPVFASLFDFSNVNAPKSLKKLDTIPVRVLSMSVGLLLLVYELSLSGVPQLSSVQIYSLFTVPLLLLYSGKRGRFKMKWFFYVFYPLHLVAIYAFYYVSQIKLG